MPTSSADTLTRQAIVGRTFRPALGEIYGSLDLRRSPWQRFSPCTRLNSFQELARRSSRSYVLPRYGLYKSTLSGGRSASKPTEVSEQASTSLYLKLRVWSYVIDTFPRLENNPRKRGSSPISTPR